MLKAAVIAVVSTLAIFIGISGAQEDPVTLTIGESCDSIPRLSIPVYLNNPDSVGSFTVRIILRDYGISDPIWLAFDSEDPNAADTIGSRISYWPWFNFWVDEPDTINVVAYRVGYPNEVYSLPPGDGLIFTIHPVIMEIADTCQLLRFGDGCFVYDESQYIDYDIIYVREEACSGCDPSWLHGDMDRSGNISLVDVIAMISAYRGAGFYCDTCACTGDADGNGVPVELGDVVAIIANFRTGLPVMAPCE